MEKIFIVKVVAGSYEDRIEKNIKAYENKSKAQEHADELNRKFECIVDLDTYCDAEIYVSNDIMDNISNYDGFYEFTKEMIEHLQIANTPYYESVKDAWYLLEGIYAAHKDTPWNDFIKVLLYDDDGNPSKDYAYWFAVLLKIFCFSMQKYKLEDLETAVEIYQQTWSQPHAFVEEIDFETYL